MKRKLLIICSLFTLLFTNLTSSEKSLVDYDFTYISLGGSSCFQPDVGIAAKLEIGKRMQRGHHGFAFSFEGNTNVLISQLNFNLFYHYYFVPSLSSQFYLGVGVAPGISGVLPLLLVAPSLSPKVVVGYEYSNQNGDLRFIGITAHPYVIGDSYSLFQNPLMISIDYGVEF